MGSRRTVQHFIPAAYLGRFSADRSRRPRDRPLWVYDKRIGRPVRLTAAKVARQIGLYDDTNSWPFGPGRTPDDAWGYESGLPKGLDALVAGGPLDGALWMEVLVPFVAGLFMRGPDFAEHFARRVPKQLIDLLVKSGQLDPKRNAELARFLDFQFLLAPIMVMNWTVLHFSAGAQLITSDRAYTGTVTPIGLGFAVPLDLNTVLVLTQSTRRTVLRRDGGRWLAPIPHYNTVDAEAAPLRQAIAAHARTAVYGPVAALIEDVAGDVGAQAHGHAPPMGATDRVDLGCHMYDYFRVISVMNAPGEPTQDAADTIDWGRVTAWTAPIVAELIFPERTFGGVHVSRDRIDVDLALGAVMRRFRRLAGDFRLGTHALLPLNHIRTLTAPFPRVDPERHAAMDSALLYMAHREVVMALFGLLLRTMALDEELARREEAR